jgi:hypothetical protein
MEIRGDKAVPGGEARRFSAGRAAPQAGAKSFAAALKNAGSAAPAPSAPSAGSAPPGPAESELASRTAADPARETASQAPAIAAGPEGQAAAKAGGSKGSEAPAADPDAFANHMEMVRFRLKTGYYDSKAIEDALSEKLSGYFDELA